MDDRTSDREVDRAVRGSLDPRPGAADRLARRVLELPDEAVRGLVRRRGGRFRTGVVWVALAVLTTFLLGAILVLPLHRSEGTAPPSPSAIARYSITNRGEVLVVQELDGGPSSLHSSSGRRPSPPGMRIIVLGGDRP